MNTLLQNAKPYLLVFVVLPVLPCIINFLLIEYRLYKRNKAETLTARAIAYYKHPDMEPALAGKSSSYVYYITFHTETGDILKLAVNPENYYSIAEGSWGTLTWQHDRFWKFEKEE